MKIVFAPGAGASASSPWMIAWAARLRAFGAVKTFDYDYMREGRALPDRHDALVARHRQVVRAQRGRVVLAGKSMGSRIGCHLAVEMPDEVAALVCFGYPLVGMARRDGSRPVRDEVLRALERPVLFIQGTRDPLCPLDHLERVRREMKCETDLFVVPDGDHSLACRQRELAKLGTTKAEVEAAIMQAIARFLERHAASSSAARPRRKGRSAR